MVAAGAQIRRDPPELAQGELRLELMPLAASGRRLSKLIVQTKQLTAAGSSERTYSLEEIDTLIRANGAGEVGQ